MSILSVGANQQYTRLSDAIGASHDGDVIQVQAGTYTNDFATINSKISIIGIGGMVKLVATIEPPNSKGILISNTDLRIENVEFSGAHVPDANGAGIRYQGGNLIVKNCYFHDNETHILANASPTGTIQILNSEFANHVPPNGQAHSIYIGAVARLEVRDSYFHDGLDGNMIKSRATQTVITGSRIYDNDSAVSYSIDLPNGGIASITNNVIVQGPNSPNRSIISYSTESAPYAGSSLLVQNNTIENFGGNGTAILNRSGLNVTFADNKTYALTTVVNGPSTQTGNTLLGQPITLDTARPWWPPQPDPTPVPGLNLTGTSGNDALIGGVGNDVISGASGNDTLTGNAGNDVLDGGTGTDTASYATALSGVTVDLAVTAAQDTGGAGVDTLVSIENLVGGAGNDVLGGDGKANVLSGGVGNDELHGAGGADLLDGGAGNDLLDGGTGVDTASYAGFGAGIQVNLSLLGAQNTGAAGIDTLLSIENLIGGAGNDVLIGDGGVNVLTGGAGNDLLSGAGGSDTLIGGAGDDLLDGGSGADTASYAGLTAGVSVDLTLAGAQNTGGAGFDTLVSIENVTGGNGADVLIGDAGTNVLNGGVGNDSLSGGGGVDYLNGGGGNDVLIGGAARDRLTGGAGADVFRIEQASDSATTTSRDVIADFTQSQSDVIDLAAVDANTGVAGDQAFSFVGTAAFGGVAGELRYKQTGGLTIVECDRDGDRVVDMQVELAGVINLQARDFLF